MAADLRLHGGTILTMDPARPRADSVCVRAGRIVPDDGAPARAVIDLRGGTLTPGLVDGHAHLYGLGRSLESLSLRGVTSEREAAAQAARAAGEWITGRGWDQNLWTPAEFPTRASLDALEPTRPIALWRIDGHALWVSSAALARAGVTRATPDPVGGKLVRDARGEPTGVLVDHAAELVLRAIPPETASARERMILAGAQAARARGLTGVHEMGIDDATIAVYRRLAAEGRLPLRVYAFRESAPAAGPPDVDADGSAYFTLRGVKLYADGALGSRGALMLEPYADDAAHRGLELATPAEIAQAAAVAAQAGWQLAVHAIGDRANRNVLDACAAYAGRGLRFRVEHAQIIAPVDLPRFAALGVVAAMQPSHAASDAPWLESRLGAARAQHGAYAWRALLDSGAHVVGGSDFPIEEAAPLLGLHAAVTRAGGERLTLEQALRLYTVEPAWASFVEGQRGVIRAGAVADFTWFDRELRGDDSLLDVQVVATIVGGEVSRCDGGVPGPTE